MNVLEFAIKMELEGEKYYTKQAEINKGNSLSKVFLTLAKDEKIHAQILEKKANHTEYVLEPNETLAMAKNVFSEKEAVKSEIRDIPSQLDAYRAAMKNEQESIDFYKRYLTEAQDEDTKALFRYLIQQEEEHLHILDQIVTMLSHSEEWVEDAEFGLRKEY